MYTPDARSVLDLLLSTDLKIKELNSPASFEVEAIDEEERVHIRADFILDDTDQSVIGIELSASNLETASLEEPAATAIFHDLLEYNSMKRIGLVIFDAVTGSIGYEFTDWLPLVGDDAEDDQKLLHKLITCFSKNAFRLRDTVTRARESGKSRHRRSQERLSTQIDEVFERSWREFGDEHS